MLKVSVHTRSQGASENSLGLLSRDSVERSHPSKSADKPTMAHSADGRIIRFTIMRTSWLPPRSGRKGGALLERSSSQDAYWVAPSAPRSACFLLRSKASGVPGSAGPVKSSTCCLCAGDGQEECEWECAEGRRGREPACAVKVEAACPRGRASNRGLAGAGASRGAETVRCRYPAHQTPASVSCI